jgi:succinate dehydrogenase / fumarate reductase cytochrome b subunit
MKTPTYSEFVLRRLHSLTGVIPLTFFIFFHFFANSTSQGGEEAFDSTVTVLRSMPYLLAVEWALLFAPFLFHMLYGMYLIFATKPNAAKLNYRRNWAYVLQRLTAMVVFVFIVYHVIGVRFIDTHGETAVYAIFHEKMSNPFTYWWYVVGIACTSFHLANGLVTFLMTWGITVSTRSQKMAEYGMAAVGLLVFVIGIGAINGFLKAEPVKVPTTYRGAQEAATAAAPALEQNGAVAFETAR